VKILVINAGSSSMKYQFIDMSNEQVIAKGICERIGISGTIKATTHTGASVSYEKNFKNHTEAFAEIEKVLTTGETKVINNMEEVSAVGHRIVQGGSIFKESCLVTEKVIDDIEGLCDLAPLHNAAHVQGIRSCLTALGTKTPQVVVFDTSFHATMPEEAYMFAIPYEYYEKYQIRRYGFHGTSHRYVSGKCAELLGKSASELKIITCHLGNGSSLAAVKGGKVIDTSMGLTPLDGFMMGSRSGSLDPSVVTFIQQKEGLTPKQTDDLLNKKSGVLGISGISSDDRDVTAATKQGNKRAALAQKMLAYQIKKYIGSYIAALGGVDAIVFTGGLGENVSWVRKAVCENMEYLGIKLNEEKNEITKKGLCGDISEADYSVRLMVIPTDEEMVIARDTAALINK